MPKVLLQNETPVTQSVDAVEALLAYVGRSSDPLPTDVALDNGRLVLVLNNKKDAYYCTMARACSCPSATYRPGGACKHQRKYFPEPVAAKTASSGPLIQRGGFKPFDTLPGEKGAA